MAKAKKTTFKKVLTGWVPRETIADTPGLSLLVDCVFDRKKDCLEYHTDAMKRRITVIVEDL